MNCNTCKGKASKNGKQGNGTQRYYCKTCKISFQETYRYKAYCGSTDQNIALLLCSSVGVNDIAKIIGISKNTVLRRKLTLGSKVKKPMLNETHQEYELDEMRIVVGRKKSGVLDYVCHKSIDKKSS